MRDRDFLQTILPISDGLNCVLQSIFEVDPKRRISLDALREYILICPSLSRDPVETSLPPSPTYSPIEKAVDALVISGTHLEPVPNIDPLPVQQYPAFSGVTFAQPQRPLAPVSLPTPPRSRNGSPRQTYHTFQAKPAVPSVYSPLATQGGFLQSFPSWSRCSNLVPNLAQHACWRNVPVF